MTVGIIGSRRRDTVEDLAAVRGALLPLLREDVNLSLVSGGCPKGGDRFAEILAKELELTIRIHPAQWKLYGRGAGFQRNGLIAQDSDVLIACVAPDRTGGTEDTIRKYKRLGKDRVILV